MGKLLRLLRYTAWFYGTSLLVGLWVGSLAGLGIGIAHLDPWMAAAAGAVLVAGQAVTTRVLNAIYPA